jgi:predicted CXXCH cytochrome family protein
MTNFATEAYPSVIPGPSVLPLIYDNGTLFANSSGTPSVLPGEDVYLRGWGRDFNLPSPEMFDAQAFEHDNATWGLFDIYGNKNGDWSQSEFSFTWSLRDNFDNDTTYLLSSTDTQNTHFKVPDNATAGDEYIATLTVTGDDGLADAGKEIHIYVASMAPRAGSNNTCANNCHGTIRSIFVSTAHRTVANLDCQDCHGPGSLHIPLRDPKYVPVSHWPGICGKCHTQFAEWQKSRHSDPPAFGHAEIASNTSYSLLVNCYKCHYTDGYIGAVESGLWFSQFEYPLFGTGTPEYIPEDTPNVGCDVCHDPHDQTNPLGLRTWNKEGYPCQTCHVEKWQNATYTALGDLIENAYHWDDYSQYEGPYDNETGTGNPHYQSKACVLCHMANDITDTDSFGVKKVGGHTMKMRDVGADGDPDTGDDLLNIVVCQGCHSGLTTFDRNGVRTRIKNKLNNLGDLLKANNHEFLPPFQPGKCAKCHRGGTLPFINESSLQVFEKAYTNYKLVLHDRSFGIHNPGYIERLLDDSIAQAENAWKICVADLDCSKTVNSFDLLIMKLDYNKKNCIQDNETYCCQADIDNSTKVDSHDLLLMKLDYNKKDCFPCVAPCLF